MQQNNTTNNTADAVENADVWALARNQIYRDMQQKLNERTAERDIFRYVNQLSSLKRLSVCLMPFRQRSAYVELVRAIGPDVFDDVPDRFNIKGLIAQAQQIEEQLANI